MSETKSGMTRTHTEEEIRALLVRVGAEHGMRLELVGAFRGGEGPGAYELVSERGPAVLKVQGARVLERMPRVIDALRVLASRGYPVPEYLAWGADGDHAYLIQTRIPGRPLSAWFAARHVPELTALNDLQADIGVDLPDSWPEPVVSPVLYGADGFCVLETMREHSSESAELLRVLQNMVTSNVDRVEERRDVVHLDFTSSNILAVDGEITGVIDWEAAFLGDRAFDLVSLQYYVFDDPSLRGPLWNRALELSGPAALKVYFAHIILRQVEWSIRFHSPEFVARFMGLTRDVLEALDTL